LPTCWCGAAADASAARAGKPKEKDIDAARDDIREGIARLKSLAALQPTIERQNLIASAYKRLTMVESRAGRKEEAKKALDELRKQYSAAEKMALEAGADNLFYPAKNVIGADLCAAFLEGELPKLAKDSMKAVRESLQKAATDKPDFWSVVGLIELQILEAAAKGRLASAEPALTRSLRGLKARVQAVGMWDSVYNEAQFTLEPYVAMMKKNPDEQRAAQRLLDALKEMATA